MKRDLLDDELESNFDGSGESDELIADLSPESIDPIHEMGDDFDYGDVYLDDLDPLKKLDKDLEAAGQMLSQRELRYLVDLFYSIQKYRIATNNQKKSLDKLDEPNALIGWALQNFESLEKNLAKIMDRYSRSTLTGRWMRSQRGVGPVLAAGILGHLDITRAPTAGHFWRYAGLDPSLEWLGREKAQKLVDEVVGTGRVKVKPEHLVAIASRTNRSADSIARLATKDGKITASSLAAALARRPWNSKLKSILWRLGECFVKAKSHELAFYGRKYDERKEIERKKNEQGDYAAQAAAKLAKFNITAEPARSIYVSGKLPPAHIHERSKRWVVKLFLSHLHAVLHVEKVGVLPPPPRPYIVEHGGHVHILPAPDPAGVLPDLIPAWMKDPLKGASLKK